MISGVFLILSVENPGIDERKELIIEIPLYEEIKKECSEYKKVSSF